MQCRSICKTWRRGWQLQSPRRTSALCVPRSAELLQRCPLLGGGLSSQLVCNAWTMQLQSVWAEHCRSNCASSRCNAYLASMYLMRGPCLPCFTFERSSRGSKTHIAGRLHMRTQGSSGPDCDPSWEMLRPCSVKPTMEAKPLSSRCVVQTRGEDRLPLRLFETWHAVQHVMSMQPARSILAQSQATNQRVHLLGAQVQTGVSTSSCFLRPAWRRPSM
mmetsp:Transcript_108089/g.345223  ORF Transcript_108089/g.345223 Transcript_108089/m.345223 type:complete len:218 (+) Transcript_108089:783-1436(+)